MSKPKLNDHTAALRWWERPWMQNSPTPLQISEYKAFAARDLVRPDILDTGIKRIIIRPGTIYFVYAEE